MGCGCGGDDDDDDDDSDDDDNNDDNDIWNFNLFSFKLVAQLADVLSLLLPIIRMH